MEEEKLIDALGSPTELRDAERNHIVVDVRKLLLATIVSGLVSIITICIFINIGPSPLKIYVLPGAESVLRLAVSVSKIVAVLTVISRVQFGSFSFISQGGSLNCVRAFVAVVVFTFASGCFRDSLWNAIYPPMDPSMFGDMGLNVANATVETGVL